MAGPVRIARRPIPALGTAWLAASLAVVLGALAAPLAAQQPVASPSPADLAGPPHIAVTARGETRVVPDKAILQVAVETRAQTAAQAAAENAATQTKVIEALKAAGIPAAQIRTAGYNVYPEQEHREREAPRTIAYRAHNMVTVEVNGVENIAKVIDAALAAGATNVHSGGAFASNTNDAREEALRSAVARAREEAEAIASAAGGQLGRLLEVTTEMVPSPRIPFRGDAAAMMSAAGTPIEAGEQVVVAYVHARWQFVPGQR